MTFTVGLDMNMRIFILDHSTFQLTIYAWLKKSFLHATISDILFTDGFVINRIYMIHFRHRRRSFTI